MSHPGFHFSLERVLNVRETQTLQAQQMLAEAQTLAGRALATLLEARAAREAFAERLAGRRLAGMQAWEWAAADRQYDMLCQAVRWAEEAHAEALKVVDDRRLQLQEAMRREDMLLSLRDRQLEAFQVEELRAEQATVDELAQAMRRTARG